MNGIINVIKPPGMTSSGAVVYLRRILGEKRIGHTGTLDPGAAGVLPVCVGRSTKLSQIIMDHEKSYLAEILFGVSTDTLDSYGELVRRCTCDVSEQELSEALPHFTGELMQTPPAYSAVKIDGKKSYELARKGIVKSKPPRRISIFENKLIAQTGKNRFLVRIRCSKGTYIRKLAEDMGEYLGLPACLMFLLRESSGGYELQGGYTLDEIAEMTQNGDSSFLNAPETAVLQMERVDCDNRFAIDHGMELSGPCPEKGLFRVYCEGDFYGLGEPSGNGYKLAVLLKD